MMKTVVYVSDTGLFTISFEINEKIKSWKLKNIFSIKVEQFHDFLSESERVHYISYSPLCYVYGNNGKSASFHVPRRQMTSLNKQHSSSFLMLSQWHIISSNRTDGTHWTAAILLNVLSICPSEVEFPMAILNFI